VGIQQFIVSLTIKDTALLNHLLLNAHMVYNTHFLPIMCSVFHAERVKNLDILKKMERGKTAIKKLKLQ
jgi:hypothetical protein